MKSQKLLLAISLFLFVSTTPKLSIASSGNEIASDVQRLVETLFSDREAEKADAHLKLCRLAEGELSGLEALINEMNKPQYLSSARNLEKLNDPKWKKRIWLAGIVEFATKEDFKVKSSAHGWDPDISFRLINEWWAKYKKRKLEQDGTGQPM